MKRLPRDPIRFDVFNAFDVFGQEEKISLRNPAAADGFVTRTRGSVERCLSNEAFLHGLRTERMFESLVASLGAIEILKQEDSGEIYVSDETLRVPDYRLVLGDGSHMLVEVKNFYQEDDPMQPFELAGDYFEGLMRYSKAMGSNLLLAIYWAKWNIWTLVRPEAFRIHEENRILSMPEAMKENHMASLGDYSIGTKFPLSLLMHADRTKPRFLGPDGSGTFTISKVEVYCAGQQITDPVERRIATHLMFYGRWNYETEAKIANDRIEAVEHRWIPVDDNEQGFEVVGSLSEMFSTFYRFATEEEGEVGRLRLDITPGSWGNLIPEDYKGKHLPLWRFRQEPSMTRVQEE